MCAMRCASNRCPRAADSNAIPPFVCRCGAGFCNEACWVQAWHGGHQSTCPHAADFLVEAVRSPSTRKGGALLASVALSRRPAFAEDGSAEQQVAESNNTASGTSGGGSAADTCASASSGNAERPCSSSSGSAPPAASAKDFAYISDLGTGACGRVTKVIHTKTREVFALKAIERRQVLQYNLQAYVDFEVTTQRQLNHPNIVRLHDKFEDEDRVYLLLEFAPGGSLYSRIRRDGRIAEPEAGPIFGDVVAALAYLHGKALAHRDLKPENVVLFAGDKAKLADFGWCTDLVDEGRRTFCGTTDYLSPEMISRQAHDHRVDVWAAGVLLYEMLAGVAPFHSDSAGDQLERILKADLQPPPGSLSAGALAVIEGLLKVKPCDRSDLREVLRSPFLRGGHIDKLQSPAEGSATGVLARASSSSSVAADRPAGPPQLPLGKLSSASLVSSAGRLLHGEALQASEAASEEANASTAASTGLESPRSGPTTVPKIGGLSSLEALSKSGSSGAQGLSAVAQSGRQAGGAAIASAYSARSMDSTASSVFATALRPCRATPSGSSTGKAEGDSGSPFLLSSCLRPVSERFTRGSIEDSPDGSKKPQHAWASAARPMEGAESFPRRDFSARDPAQAGMSSRPQQPQAQPEEPVVAARAKQPWRETSTYSAVRSWVRTETPRTLGKELDIMTGRQAPPLAVLGHSLERARAEATSPSAFAAALGPKSVAPPGVQQCGSAHGQAARQLFQQRGSDPSSSSAPSRSSMSALSLADECRRPADSDVSTDGEDDNAGGLGRSNKLGRCIVTKEDDEEDVVPSAVPLLRR